MIKTEARLLTALFCVFLGGLLLWHIALPDREKSEVENRTLAQTPTFSWETLKSGQFSTDAEKYITDQFPLRDNWTAIKARCEQALGKKEFHGIYLCEDSLISKVEEPEEKLVAQNLGFVNTFSDRVDAKVYMGMIPSAAEIYQELLPAGAPSFDQSGFIATESETTGLEQIDFYSTLMEHKDEAIFYRTDHHWTTLGAFYGANAVLKQLGVDPIKQNDFTPEIASNAFNGTLYSTSGIHWLRPDTIEYWVSEDGLSVTSWKSGAPKDSSLYDRSYLEKKDKYSSFLGGNQPVCVIRNASIDNDRKIMLVRDSYSDSMAPFLAQRFKEVHLIDLRTFHNSTTQYAAEEGIDTIVIAFSIPNFIAERNMVFLPR